MAKRAFGRTKCIGSEEKGGFGYQRAAQVYLSKRSLLCEKDFHLKEVLMKRLKFSWWKSLLMQWKMNLK